MNYSVYRYLCLFALLLAQFVYPPQSKAQSSASVPLTNSRILLVSDLVGQYDQGKCQRYPIGKIDWQIVREYAINEP